MASPFFVASGIRYDVSVQPADVALQPDRRARALRSAGYRGAVPSVDLQRLRSTITRSPVLSSRFHDPSRLAVADVRPHPARAARAGVAAPIAPRLSPNVVTVLTETVIAEGLRGADREAARRELGAEILDEAREGKVLLRVDSVEKVFPLLELLYAREVVATPNFLRRAAHRERSAPVEGWALDRIGAPAAWRISRGIAGIRVAVLDEGVDTRHPALRAAVVAEQDFIGENGASARPDGDDAHGTACAGIAVSRDRSLPGVAPGCSLVAARIAMGDGADGWVFDDFRTADAIDWCVCQGADVLSNSWGGGAPSDAIARALARARTQGRNGKGAVVAIAAGNAEAPIDFPGNLRDFVTVGASNQRDERKTRRSSDGEDWWGSAYGPTLVLLAPGVAIGSTDIAGARGYEPGDFTATFNGTSAATPFVAGAAALMLSVNPDLDAAQVRAILARTARPLAGQEGWTQELGHGRLDVEAAVLAARRGGAAAEAPRARPRARAGASRRARARPQVATPRAPS